MSNFRTKKCDCCDGTGYILDHVAVGDYYRRMREKIAHKSLREIAKRMDVSAPFLSDLERGRRNWTEERIEQYRKALRK